MLFNRYINYFKHYNKPAFKSDLKAGLIVGVIALPLAIAFGIGTGVSPEVGLISAIVAGVLASLLGGCRLQVSGPTGALILVSSSVLQQFGITGLMIATFMAGIMLIGMGMLKLGSIIKFIPYPIVVGLTTGIGFGILTTQVPGFLGLKIEEQLPLNLLSKWIVFFKHMHTIDITTAIFSVISILLIRFSYLISKKIPSYFMIIVIMTLVGYIWNNYTGLDHLQTLGDQYKLSLNYSVTYPEINLDTLQLLLPNAFSIAMMCAIVTLLCSVVADGATGHKHDSNKELIGQGISNIGVSLIGGIPSSGAVARTVANIHNGAKTPTSGLIQAAFLAISLILLAPVIESIPVFALASILVYVAYNMSNISTIRSMLQNPKSDVLVLFITVITTVVFSLTTALQIGLLLAVFLFLKRVSETSKVSLIKDYVATEEYREKGLETSMLEIPEDVEVYEIDGPFFFGTANKFDDIMHQMAKRPKVRILRMRKVPFIDSTGVHNLENFILKSQKYNITIILSGVRKGVKQTLLNTKVDSLLGEGNICNNITEALERAKTYINTDK